MQKLITITINVDKLQAASQGVFTITEVEEINSLLEDGWSIEEWEFLSGDEDSERAVLLVILNDEMQEPGFESEMFSMEEETEGEDEEEKENDENGEGEEAENEEGQTKEVEFSSAG